MMDSVQTLFHDFRYAVRQLVNHPAFSITALLSLGLGIGATTGRFQCGLCRVDESLSLLRSEPDPSS